MWHKKKKKPKLLFDTSRTSEYLVLPKKPQRAAELKTNLRTGHNRVGFGELLYQPSSLSATLCICIYTS